MKRSTTILAGILIALAAIATLALLTNGDKEQQTRIRFAANYPLSGELAFYGGELRDGMLMAFDDKGSAMPGDIGVSFDWGDNQFQPKEAATVLQRQLQDNPTVYSTALKPQVMAVEETVAESGIPHLAWVLDVSPNPNKTSNNFRCWVSFKLEVDVFVQYAKHRDIDKAVLIFVSLPSAETAYGEYLAGRLRKEIGCDVVIERYNPDVGLDDFKSIAARVAAEKPDLVLVNGFLPQMVGIIRALRPLGVIGDGNTLASLDMLDANDALSPQESEGIVVAAPPFLIEPTRDQLRWSSRFEEKFGRKPSYHAAFAYDAGLTLIDAAGRLDHPASHTNWLSAILETQIDGITGPVRYGDDQSLITTLQPAVYRGGELTPLQAAN